MTASAALLPDCVLSCYSQIYFKYVSEIENDPEGLASRLFQTIFFVDLGTPAKADEVCCTKSDGKRLLNQEYLRGIRSKYYNI